MICEICGGVVLWDIPMNIHHTWNSVCQSYGGKNCHIAESEREDNDDDGLVENGNWTGKVNLLDHTLAKPLLWKKPRMIFVNSMSDLFHDDVPMRFIKDVFYTMQEAQRHTFQVLTKRPDRMLEQVKQLYDFHGMKPLPNLWLGTSIEDQKAADERIPLLLKCPAAVQFLSLEPLLGPIDFDAVMLNEYFCLVCCKFFSEGEIKRHVSYCCYSDVPYSDADTFQCSICHEEYDICDSNVVCPLCDNEGCGTVEAGMSDTFDPRAFRAVVLRKLDWVIIGCESGPNRRPMELEWVRDIRDQCKAAAIPIFIKQLPINGKVSHDMDEWPEDLRIREFLGVSSCET